MDNDLRDELTRDLSGYVFAGMNAAQKMSERIDARDSIGACRWVNRIMENLTEASTLLVEIALREGHTQREIADALGVRPSALKGAKQEILGR